MEWNSKFITVIKSILTAGVGLTGQTGEFFGEMGLPSLLSLVRKLELTELGAFSRCRLNRERSISNSRCLSVFTFWRILFSSSWVRIPCSKIERCASTALPESDFNFDDDSIKVKLIKNHCKQCENLYKITFRPKWAIVSSPVDGVEEVIINKM